MPNQAPLHEGIEASGGTVIQALTLGICLRWVVNFTAQQIYPWYPFSKRLGGPQSWSRDFKEEKNLFPWSGIYRRSLGLVVSSLVTMDSLLLLSRSHRKLAFIKDFNLRAPW